MNDAELVALTTLVNAETEGFKAENQQREHLGQSVAWPGDFDTTEAARELRAELKHRRILP